ncbi:putative Dihydroorotate dehydrogenase (quinone), mitochondrial [Hypsibius exemplaris]|uniref:Dihydroorotate dehydrogenase (Quinone), mitochondrial n=1 Tax=Hypsibius exemplaris TaxID=2072580 RepID=A0A9X6RN55_HYPEX|nr:putative Dihydroorotate dehydrogenase (quinone), mitochondrial [Hypsibius exemplaris]
MLTKARGVEFREAPGTRTVLVRPVDSSFKAFLMALLTQQQKHWDYVTGVRVFNSVADFLVVNVSSPNTPGLRVHQQRDKLDTLLRAVLKERDSQVKRIPVLLKIAPDLTLQDQQSIADVALELKLDGLVISNTTTSRPESLISPHQTEIGGLSGAPLRELALETLQAMYRLTRGKIPIIGLGGISVGHAQQVPISNLTALFPA